jgi:putative component of membrane protein insertase Oxa1/YidC/SpoIIIJ protein YidD
VLSISIINWYQRRLSPLKGFACPHRLLYGHDSCSQFAKRAIGRCGFTRGMLLLRRRLAACGHAAEILDYQSPKPKKPRPNEEGGSCNSVVPAGTWSCLGDIADPILTNCLGQLACEMIGGGCL